MKHKNFFSRVLSIILTVTIVLSVFTVAVSAVENTGENASMQNDITVSGTNSIGTMLANEIEAQNEENEGNDGYNVLSVEVEDNEAYVTFETATDAILLVAIYNEACDTLIATGTTEVTKDETEVPVTIDIEEMPQYFYVKGYLVDAESSKPFCVAYESPNYTQEMQEFFAKTTDDFEEDLVLNFDDSNDNNFAVYNENVTLIGESEETNNLVSADDTTKTYVFENINEEISGLQEGDIFSYDYSDGNALVVKISTIKIDGTTATIVGTDTTLDEIFDYMKIDSTASESDYTYEDTDVPDGVIVKEAENNDENSRALDADKSKSFTRSIELNYSPNDAISISGSGSLKVESELRLYISLSYQYIELTISNELKIAAKISISADVELSLGKVKFVPVTGLTVTFKPAWVIEGELDLELNLTVTSQLGFSASSDKGFKNLCTSPKPDFSIDLSCEFFIGFKITIDISFVKVINCEISASSGVVITLNPSNTKDTSSQKHDCKLCNEGELSKRMSLSVSTKIFKSEKAKLEGSVSVEDKLSDIYYSVDHSAFGFGQCPYKKYKLTVAVKDNYGNFVNGANVNDLAKTDENGKADIFLPYGKNFIFVTDGNDRVLKMVDMMEKRMSVTVVLKAKQSDSNNSGNDDSENDAPTITGEVVQIAAGGNSSAAVTKDGDLYMWGSNDYGQLGIRGNASKNEPTLVNDSSSSLPEKSVKYVCIGEYHSAAITADGSLYMWGRNNYGQLGDGTATDRYLPIKIMDNVISVDVGVCHTAAVTSDGVLYTWGCGYDGRLGNGSTNASYIPIKIMENVASVSLGYDYSAAITTDGSLYTWGHNHYGQLGNGKSGTDEHSRYPVKITEKVASVNLGFYHSAAITTDGSLYTWGLNSSGQLGDGTTEDKTRPQKVASNVAQVELGKNYTTAISKEGKLYAWGLNSNGQLGNGTTSDKDMPTKIMDNIVGVATGYSHTIAVNKSGTLYTWGYNKYGQLGDETYTDKTTPEIIEVYEKIPALTKNGLKYGITPNNGSYSFFVNGEISQIAAGGDSSAAVTKDGDLYMWGRNDYGQLGIRGNASKKEPTLVNDGSSTLPEKSVKYVCIGEYHHSAAITTDGSLYMWGSNDYGQLGDGTTTDRYLPVKIMDNVVEVSLGAHFSAAVTADGVLYTWGCGYDGRLGSGSTNASCTPIKIMENVASASLGYDYSAAITTDGNLYMWGNNGYGQVGNGTTGSITLPEKITEKVASVDLGYDHSAAITTDGSLYTWGLNSNGQLGDGTTEDKTRPQKVASNVAQVELGKNYTTAVSKDGALYTWGANGSGQLGDGTTSDKDMPTKIMNNIVNVVAGSSHTIAISKDGTVYTWGCNKYGQLGDETYTDKTSPVSIKVFDKIMVLSMIDGLEPVGASSTQRTVSFTGYKANAIYNFYSLKSKDADTLLTDDNILYVDQVRADSNGKITITYTPKADCDSPYEFVASITQIDLSNAVVSDETLVYNGKMQTVAPTVKVNSTTLYEGIDYTITGEYEAKNVGEYTYTMIGKGDFVGNITKTFTIKAADINDCDASEISPISFTGNSIEPEVVLSMNNNILKKDVDYTVEYQNNENVGIGIVVIKGIGNYSGRKVCWFDITKCDISSLNKPVITNCCYFGETVIPEIYIHNNGVALVEGKDYKLTLSNNDSVGTATAIIEGIGNYNGKQEATFQIKEPAIGDVNMDGNIDVNDVSTIMAYNVELIDLSDSQLALADVNGDGCVDVLDVTLLQKYIAQYVSSLSR